MKIAKTVKYAVALVLAFAMLFSLAACGGDDKNVSESTVSFTDALGREVSVEKKPKRVAALLGSFADVWLLAGGELCAAADDAWEDFGLSLDDCVNIGGAHSPSLELLVASDPDFVIASASTASNVEMGETLSDMGISIAYFDVDNFENYLAMLKICTDITERTDLYEKNGLAVMAEIEKIKAEYKSANVPEAERKILLLRTASSFVKAKGSSGTILGEMLADIGCINVADSDTSLLENLSVEAVIRENPSHIFVVTMGSNTDKALESLENMMKENPAWSGLWAVKNGRMHLMDKTLFNLKPNDRWAEAYGILYEKLIEK